jgi:hypothetical protein
MLGTVDRLVQASSFFRYPCAVHADESFTAEYRALLLKLFVSDKIKQDKVRFWLNYKPSHKDNSVIWQNHFDLSEHNLKVIGNDKVGLIITDFNEVDERISRLAGEFTTHLLKYRSLPLGGIQLSYISGNYGFTPLGVHSDGFDSEVIHLHLGPNKKKMFLWEPEVIFKATNNNSILQVIKDFEFLLPLAQVIEYGPGDVFFMPKGLFHIAEASEVSDCIAFSIVDIGLKEYYRSIWAKSFDSVFTKEYDNIDQSSDHSTLELLNTVNEDVIRDVLESTLKRERYKLISNNGLLTTHQNDSPKLPLESSILQLQDNFTIYCVRNKDLAILIIRGLEVLTPNSNSLDKMIEHFNLNKSMSVASIKAEFENEWEQELIYYFIKELLRTGAFSVISRE